MPVRDIKIKQEPIEKYFPPPAGLGDKISIEEVVTTELITKDAKDENGKDKDK